MRKTALLILAAAVSASLFAGYTTEDLQGTATTPEPQTETAEPTEAITEVPTKEPTATPEPGPVLYTPADLLGSEELNPFFGMQLPESFVVEGVTIKTAGWGGEGDTMRYIMDILAPMDNESVISMLNILGIEDMDAVSGYIAALQGESLLEIDGYEMEGVLDCYCKICMTPKENGWAIRLTSVIDEEGKADYYKFIKDNRSMNLFAPIDSIIPELSGTENFIIEAFYIDEDGLMQTSFEVAYPFEDLDALLQCTLDAGGYSWYNGDSKIVGYDYGKMSGKIWFSYDFGMVNVTQTIKGVPDTSMSGYIYEPVITMQDYGLGFSPESGMSVYENHEGDYSSLAFASAEWGGEEGSWTMEFGYSIGGKSIYVWYYPQQNKYQMHIDMENSSSDYVYDTQASTVGEFGPDKETVEKYLNELYSGRETEDVYLEIFRILEQYTQERMGISFGELAALPPAEEYPALTAVPKLPKPEDLRVTLRSLGFEFLADEGICRIYDEETDTDISIFREDWKRQADERNRNVVRYYKSHDGKNIEIAYYPKEGVYEAHAYFGEPAEESPQAYVRYKLRSGRILDEVAFNTKLRPKEFFAEAFGLALNNTLYTDMFAQFENYALEEYGMTPDEFYALEAE